MRLPLPNEKAYDRAGKEGNHYLDQNRCCLCGNPVSAGADWLLVAVNLNGTGETAISHPCELAGEEDVLVVPVGSDCLRRHPEIKPAVLRRP